MFSTQNRKRLTHAMVGPRLERELFTDRMTGERVNVIRYPFPNILGLQARPNTERPS